MQKFIDKMAQKLFALKERMLVEGKLQDAMIAILSAVVAVLILVAFYLAFATVIWLLGQFFSWAFNAEYLEITFKTAMGIASLWMVVLWAVKALRGK